MKMARDGNAMDGVRVPCWILVKVMKVRRRERIGREPLRANASRRTTRRGSAMPQTPSLLDSETHQIKLYPVPIQYLAL